MLKNSVLSRFARTYTDVPRQIQRDLKNGVVTCRFYIIGCSVYCAEQLQNYGNAHYIFTEVAFLFSQRIQPIQRFQPIQPKW